MNNRSLIKISLVMTLLFLVIGCAQNNQSSGAQSPTATSPVTSNHKSSATASLSAETPSSAASTLTEEKDSSTSQTTTALAQTSSLTTPTSVPNEPTVSAVVTPVTPSVNPKATSETDGLVIHNEQEASEFLWNKEFQRNPDIVVNSLSSSPDQRGMMQYFLIAYSQSMQVKGGSGTVGKYWVTSDGLWGLKE
ncbi:MAG: hypothetical protein Q3974_02340 [Rothia sp. (in: high G+C Gram-positive bacteria)]|nr:hypothetical protein [Rothia sp. (in: high G+C Gram-positive bacteria)]